MKYYVHVKLDEKSSLFKTLKEKELLNYNGFLVMYLGLIPRIGESFTLPYSSMTTPEKNKALNTYLGNRKNPYPVLKVDDLIIEQNGETLLCYNLKCTYIKDTENWLYQSLK